MADLVQGFEKQFPRWRALAQKLLDALWARPDFGELRARYASLPRVRAFHLVCGLFDIPLGKAGSTEQLEPPEISFADSQGEALADILRETITRLAEDIAKPLGIADEQPFTQLVIGQALLCQEELRQAQAELHIAPGQVYVPALPAYRPGANGSVSLKEAPAWTEADTILVHRQARLASPSKRLPYGAVHPRKSAIETVGALIHERRQRKPRMSWSQIAKDPDIVAEYGPVASEPALSRLYRRWLERHPL